MRILEPKGGVEDGYFYGRVERRHGRAWQDVKQASAEDWTCHDLMEGPATDVGTGEVLRLQPYLGDQALTIAGRPAT
jgi:hypothetical protein